MEFAFLVGLGRPSNTGSSQSYSELLAVTLYPFFESKCNLHSPKSLFITQGCSIFLSSTLVIKNSQNAAPRRQNDKQPELYILIFYRHTLAGASWNNKHSFFFFFFSPWLPLQPLTQVKNTESSWIFCPCFQCKLLSNDIVTAFNATASLLL